MPRKDAAAVKEEKSGSGVMERVISLDEVKKHNTQDSCWLAIDGGVYDVTEYLGDHPGSEEPLVSNAGTDATEAFIDQDHSKAAYRQLAKFKIGVLPENERKSASSVEQSTVDSSSDAQSPGVIVYIIPLLVVAALLFLWLRRAQE